MSIAFEITNEDIQNVLTRHESSLNVDDNEDLFDAVMAESARIEAAALHGDDIEAQTEYAYSAIEDILMETGYLSGRKLYDQDALGPAP